MPDVLVRIAGDAAGVRLVKNATTAADVMAYAREYAGALPGVASLAVMRGDAVLDPQDALDEGGVPGGLLLVVPRHGLAPPTTDATPANRLNTLEHGAGFGESLQWMLGGGGGGSGEGATQQQQQQPAQRHSAPNIPEDDEALQFLIGIGDGTATAEGARRALYLNRMDADAAAEWLLDHLDDADLNTPLPAATLAQLHPPRGAGTQRTRAQQQQQVQQVQQLHNALDAFLQRAMGGGGQ